MASKKVSKTFQAVYEFAKEKGILEELEEDGKAEGVDNGKPSL